MFHQDFFRAVLLASLVAFAACGDDGPTGPRGSGGGDPDPDASGTLLVSSDAIDWGDVHYDASPPVVPITLSVEDDDVGPVSGTVEMRGGSSSSFQVTQNAGTFTLQPGESMQIEVTYEPASAGTKSHGAVVFGVEGAELSLAGFSSDYPKVRIEALGQNSFSSPTNYAPFVSDDNWRTHIGSGGTYGADASWIDCASSGGWTFNGQGATESKLGFGVRTPSGVTRIRVRMGIEAESDCTQVLIQVDGRENVYENLAGCHGLDYTYSVDQTWTDTYFGTDQQGFCGGDLHVRWVEVTYGSRLVSEANWNDME